MLLLAPFEKDFMLGDELKELPIVITYPPILSGPGSTAVFSCNVTTLKILKLIFRWLRLKLMFPKVMMKMMIRSFF
jgi:hypothetical protein